ncbi:MAG TPA: DPP IV N-terminal domain-containing protein, partial [Thermoanaerobaculia bacterium]|nr:DPP IV N-terminal domain-containing protein [Thermoanaerobaculia bacterium]
MRLMPALLLVCCLAAGPAVIADTAEPNRLTDDIVFAPDANGAFPTDPKWSPDGRSLAYRWGQDKEEALWRLDTATGRSESLFRLADLKDGDQEISLDAWQWLPKGDALLLESDGDLFLYTLSGHKLRRLTRTGAKEETPRVSPDGSLVAFVRDFDLYTLDLATGKETALTTDGEEDVFLNGVNDWVYWEEIWDRAPEAYWWSPDGRRLAYLHFDEREVPTYPLLDTDAKVRWQKYPKPGEPNPKVHIGVVDARGGETAWMATGEEDSYLARVAWTPSGDAVAVQRLNRDQTRLDLLRCSIGGASGACSTFATDTWPTWINLGTDFRFLEDGRFLWGSERSGWRRLYLYDATGKLVRPVTPEGWAVASLDGLDGDSAIVTAFRTEGLGPADRQVFRAGLSKDSWEPLAGEPGSHGAVVAPKGGAWVHTWSDANHLPTLEVRTASGKLPLPFTPPTSYDPAALPQWELFFIPGPGGSKLPARILKPEGFDPNRKYPAIMYHYGGPASQVVVNRWDTRRRDLWHKEMAQRGFVVFSVDNRSSIFFGKAGEDRDHRRFGPSNLEAQLAGVEYLKSLGWVDPARIGLWGWSGGGYQTLYALLNAPGVWKAGISGAPISDFRLYDDIWTERYLETPADNPEGYRLSSVVESAGKLKDHLLIIHGFADDNVHP